MPRTTFQQSTTSRQKLTAKHFRVIAALASGSTITDAAKQVQVDRTTIYRWLRDNSRFLAELNRAKTEQVNAVRSTLQAVGPEAARTIRELMSSTTTPAGVRLKAAVAILQAVGAFEPEDIGPIEADGVEIDKAGMKLPDFFGLAKQVP